MRAAILHAPQDLRIERCPIPDPGPGDILVRIAVALTDGTDAKAYRRGHPILLGPLPAAFGHEYAGTVVATGPGAPFRVGDRVTGANSAPCGDCSACRADRQPLCARLAPLLNGAYAEYHLVPARIAAVNVHPLPDTLEPGLGALYEPLACVLNGVEAAEPEAADRVAVLGRGAIGRMLAIVLRRQGCDVTLLGSGDPDPPEAFDRVLEAAGTPTAWRRAVALLRPGGTAVMFGGLPGGTQVPFDATRLHYAGLTIRGAFHHAPRHVRDALALLAADPEPFRPLLTHRFPLDEVATPLAMTCGLLPRDGLLKAVIEP